LKENRTNYLVLEYKGEEYQRFKHLAQHLFKTLHLTNYHIYQGKDSQRVQIFITVRQLTLKEADKQLKTLSDALKLKMTKKWKSLPSLELPNAYNIVTLPYKHI